MEELMKEKTEKMKKEGKMKKHLKIDLIINSCSDCVYLEYNPYYDRVVDSGYDCKLTGKRIIDDYEYERNEFIPIPKWCPLNDYKEDK